MDALEFATKIADELFRGKFTKDADTLRFFTNDQKDMGVGWCKGAVIDVIVKHFNRLNKLPLDESPNRHR